MAMANGECDTLCLRSMVQDASYSSREERKNTSLKDAPGSAYGALNRPRLRCFPLRSAPPSLARRNRFCVRYLDLLVAFPRAEVDDVSVQHNCEPRFCPQREVLFRTRRRLPGPHD